MLSPDDRNAIEGLFRRLQDAESRGGPRDGEADELIGRLIARQPAAPYYLAQTVVVQQQALQEAERRIEELEAKVERRVEPARRGPWDHTPQYQSDRPYAPPFGYGGGGFLAGAAQTALGVAGGVMLGNMLGSMFSGGQAHAAEAPSNSAPEETAQSDDNNDSGEDGDTDFGGDGFDVGGDF
jgi:hypothetical protein